MSNREKWVSMQDVRIASTHGHVVHMKAGVPKDLPSSVEDEARKCGCVPASQAKAAAVAMSKAAEAAEDEAQADKPSAPSDPAEVIREALIRIRDRGNEDDLTSQGLPRVGVVRAEAGVDVDATEVATLWADINAA